MKKNLSIGFQGWFLTQGYTGIGQHCLGLLREMAKMKNLDLIVLIPKKISPKGVPKKWLRVIPPPFWLLHGALKKWWWERISVPLYFARHRVDWEYYPYPCPLPRSSPNRRAMTVHDTLLWTDKRYFGGRLKRFYHRLARHSLIYVDRIFTVSHTVHAELGMPAAKVLGSGAPKIPRKLQKFNYKDALVYLGGFDIRKNVPALVETFSDMNREYAQRTGSHLRLLLIGEPLHSSRYYPAVPAAPHVHRLGSLTDEKVAAILASSFAFIHFSDAEGFNIPLLQALKLGVPAIVRDIPVNREVSQNAAHFLPMRGKTASVNSLSRSLSDIIRQLTNPAQRRRLSIAGKKAANRFSWKKSAKTFLSVLRHND